MRHRKLQSFLRAVAWILGVLLFLVLALFTRMDRTHYGQMDYYKNTLAAIDSIPLNSSESDVWLAGWSKVNTTPNNPVNLVGYKPRGAYTFVQDSSFIRSLAVSNGEKSVVFLSYELMIIHPVLHNRIKEAIARENIPLDFIYMTATHTHSGMGGYMPGLAGKLAFGGYDEKVMQLLEDNTLLSIKSAIHQMDTVNLNYRVSPTENLVANRLVAEDPVDPLVRQLVFTKKTGEKGMFLTYAAHSTTQNSKFRGLSGDYPHYLMDHFEKNGFDFSLFAAGAVGSHKPLAEGNSPDHVEAYSRKLFDQINEYESKLILEEDARLSFASFPLFLRKPHYRIAQNIRLRPYIFNALFGDTNAHFDLMQLGNILLVSSSGEISGIFMQEWEKYASEHGLQLIITCFNGGYIGYITPDKYYDTSHYEVRDMNWFGPYNGAYFDEILQKFIKKASK